MTAAAALAGETLDDVKDRKELRCGVLRAAAGFSTKSADGRWSGLDVDFCRALAAACHRSRGPRFTLA